MPDYLTTAEALKDELEAVTGIGRVHEGERHIPDQQRLVDLFGVDDDLDDQGREALRGWIISRDAVREEWWTQSRTIAYEAWTVKGVQGLHDGTGSETSFQALVDGIWERLRNITTLANMEFTSAMDTPILAHTMFSDRLCHMAEMRFEAVGLHDIGSTVSPPTDATSDASTREGYADTAAQIAAYLDAITDAGSVHAERVHGVGRDKVLDLFSEAAQDLPEGRRVIRSWQVFREDDAEAREIGQRIECEATWKLQAAWSWRDAVRSYKSFQQHLDAVRAVFRQLPNLGNVDNPTMVLSSPLQIPEIGARSLMGVLTHFADCEISIQEVVHA